MLKELLVLVVSDTLSRVEVKARLSRLPRERMLFYFDDLDALLVLRSITSIFADRLVDGCDRLAELIVSVHRVASLRRDRLGTLESRRRAIINFIHWIDTVDESLVERTIVLWIFDAVVLTRHPMSKIFMSDA